MKQKVRSTFLRYTLRHEKDMERIFFFNLKSGLKNFVVVDAQSRSGNFAHINENSAKWTTPGAISHIIFGHINNIYVHPNLGTDGLNSRKIL